MAIFRYTFYKYLKAPSTWVILLISMFIAGFLGGYLPMSALNFKRGDTIAQNYAILVIAVGGGVTAFLSIFMSVFAGFKGASMFRDEVEDGTFLVMLSKPQTRAKIIFQKWLALQAMMLAYSFLSVLTFLVCVEIFDKGDTIPSLAAIGIGTLKSSIFKISAYIWAILIVVGLIFSSIAILLSTRLSAGATVGISISLGIIIPITGMVSMFTAKQDYEHIKNPTFQRMGLLLDTTAQASSDQIAKIVSMTTAQQFKGKVNQDEVEALVDKIKEPLQKFLALVDGDYRKIDADNSLYRIAVSTGDKDTFKDVWGFDFNYQLRQMASVVTNSMVPDSLKPQLQSLPSAAVSGMNLANKVIGHPKLVPGPMSWLESQLDTDIRLQIKWGKDARDLIKVIASVPQFAIVDRDGKDVSVDKVVEEVLSTSGMPHDYKMKDANMEPFMEWIRDYLKQSLVKTTTSMIHKAIYNPILSILNPSPLVDVMPEDWKAKYDSPDNKDKVKVTVGGVTKTMDTVKDLIKHYDEDIYDVIYKDVTGQVADTSTVANAIKEKDADVYALLSIIATQHPDYLVFSKTTDYIPGMTLLYIYLGIALALLPLAYAIVRREDFR